MKKRQLSQNARNGGEKRVRVSQLARSIGAVRLVRPPYNNYVGEDLQFSGSFWPSCSEEDKNTRYDMRVLEIIDKWQPAPGVSPQPGFKVGLVTSDDPNFLAPNQEEKTHFWIIDHRQFSKEWFRNKDEEEAIAAAKTEDSEMTKEEGIFDEKPKKEATISDVKTSGAWKVVGQYNVNDDPSQIGDIWECTLTPIKSCDERGVPKRYRIARKNGKLIAGE